MKRPLFAKGLSVAALVVACAWPNAARADDPYGLGPGAGHSSGTPLATWGNSHGNGPVADATSVSRASPVTRARDMLTRARFLDEAAAVDEKAATELAGKLAAMRIAAKSARVAADRASPDERELLGARADDLETDLVVSEAEVTFKRKTAADNRRVARELRLRAVKLVRDPPPAEEVNASICDPPFHYTADGRKVYRLECLR
jgi:hypothetical protein